MTDYRLISVDHDGHRWSGRYSVEDGILHVDSAYGHRKAVATRNADKIKTQAEGLLRQIVSGRSRRQCRPT